MPSRPATSQTDGRLKQNREKKHGKRKTPERPRKPVRSTVNSRMQDFLDGKITVHDLDDEEIAKGRTRGPNGKFGKQSKMIPAKFYNAVAAELRRRMEQKFAEDVEPMRAVLQAIANNPRTSPDARFKSAQYLIERGIGKVVEKTDVTVEVKKWEADLQGLLVDVEFDDEASNDSDNSKDATG